MRARFGMYGDDVGPRLGEALEIGIGRRDHQMHVENLPGRRPDRLHDRRAEGDVGHEMPVHHVDMDPVGARLVDGPHLVAEPRKIGRQN